MKVYVSGISGTAMGALALFMKKAGLEVCGSDQNEGAVSQELQEAGIEFKIGEQDGRYLREQMEAGTIDWFVYTSALPKDHAELRVAKELGLKISKRDELIDFLTKKLQLKMVAIAGTHGKTTTTAMIIWTCLKLGLPVAWLEGTTLGFAPAGEYNTDAEFLIYEADEYDRNFLAYHPWLSLITVVDYDHPDIYPTRADYQAAFEQFQNQSEIVITSGKESASLTLAGEVRRKDASLAALAVQAIAKEIGREIPEEQIIVTLNEFPGAGRRFEKIAPKVYSDYAHHPEEIKVTVQMAREEAERVGAAGVVVIYEPHQNTRQHEVRGGYRECFVGAEKVFWLPTFLTRENPKLKILTREDLISQMENADIAEPAELGDVLATKIQHCLQQNYLVILMSAGPADKWLRELFGRDI